MVQKRSFDDGEVYELSSKHQRQLEYSQLVSSLEFVPSEGATRKSLTSDEGNFGRSIYEADGKLANGIITQIPSCNNKESETSEGDEDDRLGKPFHFSFYPEYYNFDLPVRIVQSEYPPRKLIPIGPEFQAVIPEWSPHAIKNFNCSDTSETSDLIANDNDENKISGICIIPIAELVPSGYNDHLVGGGRTHCNCQDAGSIRCVRQHIAEAREKLERSLGEQRFEELGFSNMGEEVVAEKWSEKEEQLFHEVVYTNPVSARKNFWDHLEMVFPFRTKRDIISYYFNVFMLRKRAEQNRFDSLTIDSDNDEWQGSEDLGDDELGSVEEDEDSVSESPEYHDGLAHDDYYQNMDSRNVLQNYSSGPTLDHSAKILSEESGDRDVQDDSCASTDTGVNIDRVSGEGGHEYVLEHCDTKVWDAGYLSIPKNEDFLPTCNMIEEVFGVGSWNCKAREDNPM